MTLVDRLRTAITLTNAFGLCREAADRIEELERDIENERRAVRSLEHTKWSDIKAERSSTAFFKRDEMTHHPKCDGCDYHDATKCYCPHEALT